MNQGVVLIVPPRDGARSFELRGKKDLLFNMKILKGRLRETTAFDCLISRYNLHVHIGLCCQNIILPIISMPHISVVGGLKLLAPHISVVGGLKLLALTSSINLIISWQRSQIVLSLCVS